MTSLDSKQTAAFIDRNYEQLRQDCYFNTPFDADTQRVIALALLDIKDSLASIDRKLGKAGHARNPS
jgi:hypothetical protein